SSFSKHEAVAPPIEGTRLRVPVGNREGIDQKKLHERDRCHLRVRRTTYHDVGLSATESVERHTDSIVPGGTCGVQREMRAPAPQLCGQASRLTRVVACNLPPGIQPLECDHVTQRDGLLAEAERDADTPQVGREKRG